MLLSILRNTPTRPSYIEHGQKYRPDIDGLRAIAVVPVLLFHAGVTAIPGGFAGVDIFFVISGYLISKHLIDEAAATGTVSIRGFYSKRVRRIAPALICVFTASLLAAAILFFPNDLISFCKSLISAIFFVSNIYFWLQSGYFAAQSSEIPLLHTWSLSIEEQFYLFIPIIIGILATRRAILYTIITLGFLISFALSAWQTELRPGASFYLLPTRAWELLLGTLIAAGIFRLPRGRLAAEILSGLGLGAIVIAFLVFDESTPFPGIAALVPCLGAALIITSGIEKTNYVSTLISNPAFRHIGLLSYPLYLWHWPVIVFYRAYFGSTLSSTYDILIVAFVSYALALVTWKGIEVRARNRKLFSTRALISTYAASTSALVAVCLIIFNANGLPGRFSERTIAFASGTSDRAKVPNACGIPSNDGCRLGLQGTPSFVLVGDSFAGAIAPAVDQAAKRLGASGYLVHINACAPLLDYRPQRGSSLDRDVCLNRNTKVLRDIIHDKEIEQIIFTSSAFNSPEIVQRFNQTIGYALESQKMVTILYGLPSTANGTSLPLALARAEAFGRRPPVLVLHNDLFDEEREKYKENSNIKFIDLSEIFCSLNGCVTSIDGHPILSDGAHLSDYAARTMVGNFLSERMSFQ